MLELALQVQIQLTQVQHLPCQAKEAIAVGYKPPRDIGTSRRTGPSGGRIA